MKRMVKGLFSSDSYFSSYVKHGGFFLIIIFLTFKFCCSVNNLLQLLNSLFILCEEIWLILQNLAVKYVGNWWVFRLPLPVLITFASHVCLVHILTNHLCGRGREEDEPFEHRKLSRNALLVQMTYQIFYKIHK